MLLGRSYDGRKIFVTRVGDPDGPRVLVFGCIHGNEPAGIAVALALKHVRTTDDVTARPEDLLVVDTKDPEMAHLLSRLTGKAGMPLPIGVIYNVERPIYEQEVAAQLEQARKKQGVSDLDQMLRSGETWTVTA